MQTQKLSNYTSDLFYTVMVVLQRQVGIHLTIEGSNRYYCSCAVPNDMI